MSVLQVFVNQAVTSQNFKLSFLIKPFWYMAKKSRQELKYLEKEKGFKLPKIVSDLRVRL